MVGCDNPVTDALVMTNQAQGPSDGLNNTKNLWKYWRGTARIEHGQNLKQSSAEMVEKLQAFHCLN